MSQEKNCDEINNLEVAKGGENVEVVNDDTKHESESPELKSQESSTSSSSTSSSEDKTEETIPEEPPAKRRRRRKRHPKKKKSTLTVACPQEEEEPFPARYKNLQIFINSAVPKVHLRFDDDGETDEKKSEFNYKPRIISARSKNLELNENLKEEFKILDMEVTQTFESELIQEMISLKPRIIKAIGH